MPWSALGWVVARAFFRACAASNRSDETMARSGTATTRHSLLGFGRETRFPVSGSLIILTLFQIRRPA